ncbi:MAG: hypothetical protein DRI54_01840 [Bacteroidetes bacterium]|nr:MAG: hypothetical protein DRI54_01840 [Bacteroidota bacterium]
MKQRIKKISLRILIFLLVFLTGSYFAFNSAYVQQKITNYISSYLSESWGTTVKVNRINLEPFQQLNIQGLYVEDQMGDTLLYVKELYADFSKLKLLKKKYVLKELRIDELKFYLKRYKDQENLNLQFILDSLNTDTSSREKSTKPFVLELEEVELNGIHFIYQDQNIIDTSFGMHYQDLDISHVNGLFNDVKIVNDSIQFEVYDFSAKDKSGLDVANLQTKGYISSTGMDLKPLFIKLNNSIVDADRLAFKYKKWGDYKDFVSKVKMKGEFRNARVQMNDIGYFAGALEGWNQVIVLSGDITGKISNLSGRSIKLQTGDETYFDGSFNLDGLPYMQNTFITIQANELVTSGDDMENIQTYPFAENKYLEIPEGVKAMGQIKFDGEFTGFVNDFVAYGTFRTDKGTIASDVSLKSLPNDTIAIAGNFNTDNLQLGTLLNTDIIGVLSSRLSVTIKSKKGNFVSAQLEGQINRLGFNNYNYQNIYLDGLLKPNKFSGNMVIDDPALLFDFSGSVEITDDIKDLDFKADLYYADLGALHFLPIDKYSSLSGSFNWTATGYEYEEMIGTIQINDLAYCTDETAYNFGDIFLETDTISNTKSIDLISSQLDVSLNGNYDLAAIMKDLKWEIANIIPALYEPDTNYVPTQYFDYEISIKDLSFLRELDILDFDIDPGANIYGVFNPSRNASRLNFYADNISYNGIDLRFPEVFVDLNDVDIFIEIIADGLAFMESETSLNNSTLIITALEDSLNMRVDWRENDERHGAGIVNAQIFSLLKYEIGFDSLSFTALHKQWTLEENATIRIDTNYFGFQNLNFSSVDQAISFDGELSPDMEDTLNIFVQDFNLSNFNYILNQLDYSVGGISNGNIYWLEHDHEFRLESDLQIDSASVNDYYLGDILLESHKEKSDSAYNFEMRLLNNTFENLYVEGKFYPSSIAEEKIDFNLKFDDFNLDFINSLNVPGISEVDGLGSGLVNISGSFKQPVLNGQLDIIGGGVTIEAIGSHITFDTKIDFQKDYIGLDPFYLIDSKGHKALAYGTILHDHLKDWNFNLDVEMENFEGLSLIKEIDAIYYGNAYATGTFNISGYGSQLFITVDAATKANTEIFIPLGGSSTVEKQDLVTFITYDQEAKKLAELMEQAKNIKGIDMKLNITVTPDAQISLVFDEITGDVLEVRANGLIHIGLNSEGDFTMKGTLEAESGEYLFSMEGIINKRFVIQPDSRITWFGNPYDAKIDIKAIYYTRAALFPIMTIDQESYRNRVNVELELYLKEQLLTPVIEFGIKLPDAEEKERTALKNATYTTQDMNMQVVSLLLLGSFQPVTGAAQSENFAAISSYEMLSNQVSNILSSFSENVDINVNYRPETSTSGQEFAVGFSTRLLDDRLTISTDLGVRDNSIYGASGDDVNNIVGDFVAEYKLTEDGRIRLKVFNKSNDYQSTAVLKQSPYTQGIGVVFRKEFDRSLKGKSTNSEKLQQKYDDKAAKDKKNNTVEK